MQANSSFLIGDLLRGYRANTFTPAEVMQQVFARIDGAADRNVWIQLTDRENILQRAHALKNKRAEELPLYGIPFAIKDNIDLEGIPTTAGCAQFAYTPQRSATVVERLIDAGAIPIGKTNLDQFAAGLVGTRSPYGACRNSFNDSFISGGSSSGSAVAVATGLVSFSLGTDTAGSGRIPASFNNIVGLKPTRGLISTRGVVPACRSLDCVSIFALTTADAQRVLAIARGFDAEDIFSRREPDAVQAFAAFAPSRFKFGVPQPQQLQFFGDAEYQRLFDQAVQFAIDVGGEKIEIDFTAFVEAARLLYEGAWVAERYAAIEAFIEGQAAALHPVTKKIIVAGRDHRAADAFKDQYRLAQLRRHAQAQLDRVDLLITPTAGTIYSIAAVEQDPIRLNSNLGYYTNYLNLLDLAAIATPTGFRTDGLPFGVTLVGPAFSESGLIAVADRIHRRANIPLGVSDQPMPAELPVTPSNDGWTAVAVCGAHMQSLPLNHQLLERGARLLRCARTAAHYRFYALPGGPPQRPGLIRVSQGQGAAIDVEVWALPTDSFGSFVASIPAPLGIGQVELEDGAWVSGFVCESYAVADAQDISSHGGWRAYLGSLSHPPPSRTE